MLRLPVGWAEPLRWYGFLVRVSSPVEGVAAVEAESAGRWQALSLPLRAELAGASFREQPAASLLALDGSGSRDDNYPAADPFAVLSWAWGCAEETEAAQGSSGCEQQLETGASGSPVARDRARLVIPGDRLRPGLYRFWFVLTSRAGESLRNATSREVRVRLLEPPAPEEPPAPPAVYISGAPEVIPTSQTLRLLGEFGVSGGVRAGFPPPLPSPPPVSVCVCAGVRCGGGPVCR